MRVVDNDTGRDVPDGEVGELWTRSHQNSIGYWNNPDATAAAFTDDGWFKTGDAGFMEDGFVFLHDRVKDMIVSGGENVYPAEVEKDRKSVVKGKSVSVRVDLGGCRLLKIKKTRNIHK